jgi:hypothetical protein
MRYIPAVRVPRWLVVVAGGVLGLALCPAASADAPTLAGTWTAGPLSETVTVTSWVDECGPKPKAHALAGGGYKIVTSGDELVFSGPQSFRTDVCFSQEDTKRVSHTATPSLRTWKTRCESAPGDPRKASITTVVRAQSDDVIVLTESAHYSTTMATGTCSADVERARTFTIVAREGAASATASVTASASASSAKPASSKTAPAEPACDSPGAPKVVEVRPKRKILRPGEQFDFKARVLDEAGCEVPSKLTFRLAPASASVASLVVETAGRVKVHADAEPVAVTIIVEAASITKTAQVELEVVTDQRYQELLGTAGLDDAGVDDQPVAVVVSTDTDEATTTTVVPPRTDDGRRRRFGWIAIAFGSGTLLALAALVFFRGRALAARRARRSTSSTPATSTLEIAPTTIAALPASATVVGAPDAPGAVPAQIRVCPSCGERYPADAAFCPIDGQRLVAVRDVRNVAPLAPAMPQSIGRICPVCGKRYPRDAGFCGQDGVELVPIN